MVSELIKDIYPLVAKSAPIIANALGMDKIGQASMWALYLIGKAFGINMNEVGKLPEVIASDPESCDKLCQLEKSFSELFNNGDIIPNGIEGALKSLRVSNIELNVKINFDQSAGQLLAN